MFDISPNPFRIAGDDRIHPFHRLVRWRQFQWATSSAHHYQDHAQLVPGVAALWAAQRRHTCHQGLLDVRLGMGSLFATRTDAICTCCKISKQAKKICVGTHIRPWTVSSSPRCETCGDYSNRLPDPSSKRSAGRRRILMHARLNQLLGFPVACTMTSTPPTRAERYIRIPGKVKYFLIFQL